MVASEAPSHATCMMILCTFSVAARLTTGTVQKARANAALLVDRICSMVRCKSSEFDKTSWAPTAVCRGHAHDTNGRGLGPNSTWGGLGMARVIFWDVTNGLPDGGP